MEQRRGSILMAAMVAPWAAPVLFATFVCVWALLQTLVIGPARDSPLVLVPMFFIMILFGLPLSYLTTAVALVPYALWLRRRGKLAAWRIYVFTGMLGPIVMWAYIGLFRSGLSAPDAYEILCGVACGLAVGAVFARIAAPRGRAIEEASNAA